MPTIEVCFEPDRTAFRRVSEQYIDVRVCQTVDCIPRIGEWVYIPDDLKRLIEQAYPGRYGYSPTICIVRHVIHTWEMSGTKKVEIVVGQDILTS